MFEGEVETESTTLDVHASDRKMKRERNVGTIWESGTRKASVRHKINRKGNGRKRKGDACATPTFLSA